MQTSSGKIESAQKVVIYGPEGIGKSTFASHFPRTIFIDTEGSTKKLNVTRTTRPSSWAMLMDQVRYYRSNPAQLGTLVIDTGDWAEQLCSNEICSKSNKSGIEDFGYGKGYVYLAEEFGRLLNLLEELIGLGVNVVVVCHAQMRKFEQPDEMGAYDRWEMKLAKKTSPLLKEWADMVLFVNYKTYVVDVDGQGTQKGKNKAQGGKRVIYASHHPCWDAKNRDDLAPELEFNFASIAHCIPSTSKQQQPPTPPPAPPPVPAQAPGPAPSNPAPATPPPPTDKKEPPKDDLRKIPKPLADLMTANNVTIAMVQKAVSHKGYYPADTPIEKYDPSFINGVLVGAWPQVYNLIQDLELPF